MEDSNVQSPDRSALKQPLNIKFELTADGRVSYEQTWPELRANAALHPSRVALTFLSMAHTMAMEDQAKGKLHGRVGGIPARLTAEELEKVFGGDQGAAWVPTTGSKGPRSFKDSRIVQKGAREDQAPTCRRHRALRHRGNRSLPGPGGHFVHDRDR